MLFQTDILSMSSQRILVYILLCVLNKDESIV